MLIKQVIICSYIEVCARVTGGHTLANIAVYVFQIKNFKEMFFFFIKVKIGIDRICLLDFGNGCSMNI